MLHTTEGWNSLVVNSYRSCKLITDQSPSGYGSRLLICRGNASWVRVPPGPPICYEVKMTRFILIDQLMPLDFDGETRYVVWRESSSQEELIEWAYSKGMSDREYKIREITPS